MDLRTTKIKNMSAQMKKSINTVQSKQKIVEKVQVKEERRYGTAQMEQYCKFLVAPYDCDSVVEAPSITPTRRTSVRQNIVKDLAVFNANGAFFIEVNPSLSNTLNLTSSVSDTQDQGEFVFDIAWDDASSSSTPPDSGRVTHLSTGFISSSSSVADSFGLVRKAFRIDGTVATQTMSFFVGVDPTSIEVAGTLTISTYSAAGNWATLGTILVSTSTSTGGRGFTAPFTIPSNILAISFELVISGQPYSIPLHMVISMSHTAGTGLLGLEKDLLLRDSFGLPLQGAITDMQSWCVTAQDVLVTFEGDTLQDGGAIASARVPRNWTPLTNDPYSELLLLPYDRMDGPLRNGTHVHWIPGSLDDVTPVDDPIDDVNFGAYKMVVAGTITHPGASVRVRVCTAVAYFSTNPSYGNMDWAPPAVDFSLLLQYVARVVPAATSNDKHLITKLASLAGKNAKLGLKYLVENPAALAKLAATIAAMV